MRRECNLKKEQEGYRGRKRSGVRSDPLREQAGTSWKSEAGNCCERAPTKN